MPWCLKIQLTFSFGLEFKNQCLTHITDNARWSVQKNARADFSFFGPSSPLQTGASAACGRTVHSHSSQASPPQMVHQYLSSVSQNALR